MNQRVQIYSHTKRNSFKISGQRNTNNSERYDETEDKTSSSGKKCIFCKGNNHVNLVDCDGFKNLDLDKRFKFVLRNKLCWKCLDDNHPSYYRCKCGNLL